MVVRDFRAQVRTYVVRVDARWRVCVYVRQGAAKPLTVKICTPLHAKQLRIDSPTACRLDVVANIEPKVPLPQPIINFGTRKLAGMLLFYLQKHVRGWRFLFCCCVERCVYV